MRKTFLFALLMLSSSIVLGQTAYIEVKGELDLSIYLNSKFKGKITDEAGIFIIENVTPGKNLIKIVKEGYTPFEETIIVKANEVLAYKVKPFTKHKVYVSEQGNTEETDKKATVKTGKLIIQSVPIEIKITIPDIDGINKSAKTKDKWQADEIPAGTYKITFNYNQKVITKTIEIKGSETTSLFVNMLNGDFKASNSLDEKREKEKEIVQVLAQITPIIEYANKYKYLWKPNLTEQEFKSFNGTINNYKWMLFGNNSYTRDVGMPLSVIGYSPEGPYTYGINSLKKVSYFIVNFKRVKNEKAATRKFYEDAKRSVSTSENYFIDGGESFTISIPKSQNEPKIIEYYITTSITEIDKWSLISIIFHTEKSIK